MEIISNKFNVDKEGNMTCNGAILRNVTIQSGNINMIGDDSTPTIEINSYSGDTLEMYPSNFNMQYEYFGVIVGQYLQKRRLLC